MQWCRVVFLPHMYRRVWRRTLTMEIFSTRQIIKNTIGIFGTGRSLPAKALAPERSAGFFFWVFFGWGWFFLRGRGGGCCMVLWLGEISILRGYFLLRERMCWRCWYTGPASPLPIMPVRPIYPVMDGIGCHPCPGFYRASSAMYT